MVVLVAGGSGQLGQSLQFIAKDYPEMIFHFYDSAALDVADLEKCRSVFAEIRPDFCINVAAYTAVDKAESEPEKACLINVEGAANLAGACREFNTILIHISTDFVFDGNQRRPYTEEDPTNPKSVYGKTKLDGEKAIQEAWEKHIIIRTSWLYSQFGNNFLKTMIRLGQERDTLNVVNDQTGTPTNAIDLARAIAHTCRSKDLELKYGIYHYSNEGECTWFDFAKEIFELHQISVDLKPIPTSDYPTPAERPKYSVLDKSKIKAAFGCEIPNWKESLRHLIY
ncbi:MAG TPA: dTDP-4-dehydrorhamnose reductase [Flavobacterium sp.]|nr:dTDP-4-dehydrorhamnose reductase [Flavobacterium sp.]